ncbi:MAG: amidase domain-containing protein [Clostridium sp.]|nr:amidase domain-containing protein [Clostridium sp.]
MKEKFFNILTVLILALTFSIPYCAFASEKNNENVAITTQISNCENENISNLLTQYTLNKYNSLATLEYNIEFESYITNNCKEDEIIKLIIEHRKMQITDLKFNNHPITIHIDIDSVTTDENSNTKIVQYTEHSKYMYNCELNNTFSEELTEHFIYIDKDYKIVKDDYYDDFKEQYENLILQGNSYELSKEIILNNSRQRVNQSLKTLFSTPMTEKIEAVENNDNTIIPYASSYTKHSYNRDKAESYALTYALSPNSKYMNIESNGGNCTNFTSQCIYAGGIKHDKTGNYQWYYDSSTSRAPAWSDADLFRKYYKNNVGSSSVKGLKASKCTFASTRKGDLVQKVVNGKAVHTMIIDAPICDSWGFDDTWKNKYDVYICQNSTGKSSRQKHVPLSSKNIPASNLEYVHIDSCYY